VTTRGFTVFDSPIGPVGIAWSAAGIIGVQLPEGSTAKTRARLRERWPGAVEGEPPRAIRRTIDAITRLLRGKPATLTEVVLDMEGVPPFHQRVYTAARSIPPGQTLSYGELAAQLGVPGGARAVGQALAKNPFALIVPCHRVLAASGRVGGFTANGGVSTKLRLLTLEGTSLPSKKPPRRGPHALRV